MKKIRKIKAQFDVNNIPIIDAIKIALDNLNSSNNGSGDLSLIAVRRFLKEIGRRNLNGLDEAYQ